MAVKFKTNDVIEKMGIKLTPEQQSIVKEDFEIEGENKTINWKDVQIQFKNDIDKLKEQTILKRFKNGKDVIAKDVNPKKETENTEIKFDKEELKKQIRNEMQLENAINMFKDDDKNDAEDFIKAKMSKGKTLKEAFEMVSKRFGKNTEIKKVNNFGQISSDKIDENNFEANLKAAFKDMR